MAIKEKQLNDENQLRKKKNDLGMNSAMLRLAEVTYMLARLVLLNCYTPFCLIALTEKKRMMLNSALESIEVLAELGKAATKEE